MKRIPQFVDVCHFKLHSKSSSETFTETLTRWFINLFVSGGLNAPNSYLVLLLQVNKEKMSETTLPVAIILKLFVSVACFLCHEKTCKVIRKKKRDLSRHAEVRS